MSSAVRSKMIKSQQKSSRKGGGGAMIAGVVSRRERGISRKKPPPFKDEDVKKHSPKIKASWERAMAIKGYFNLGLLYYDTLFVEAAELGPLFTEERERMGAKFIDMLTASVSVCHDPAKIHEKLESLAPMHIQRNVRATDMPSMGKVVFAVLHIALGDEFTEDVQEAWGWLWAWLTQSMTITLESAGSGRGSIVSQSWDICMDNYGEEELGGMLYDTLFDIAPSLKEMFGRPRPVMAMKFVEMLNTLVSFSDDQERMIEQVNWLGSRHVKYGSKPHHVPIVGQVILTVLEQAVGDEWTDEMHTAWLNLWNTSCAKMMDAIKGGETYGHVVEGLWESVSKKGDKEIIGRGVYRKLSQKHSDLVNNFTTLRREYLDEARAKALHEMELEDKKPQHEKKESEKPNSANSLVISTNAPPPPTYDRQKGAGRLAKLKKRMFSSKLPDTEMSARNMGDDEESHAGDDDDIKKPVKVGKDGKECEVRKAKRGKTTVAQEDAIDAWGTELYDMLQIVMDMLWEPEQMNERLIVIATKFFLWGMKCEHLDDVGDALHQSMRVVLECPCAECGNHEWNDEISDAWAWVWGMVKTSFTKTIGSLEADHHKIVREMWELAKTQKTSDEIGDALYAELGREAPFVLHLFQRPKKLQAYMWMQALELLVVFTEVPEKFFEELRLLTIRHIKYGVKAEYIKPFGKAVMAGLEGLFGEEAWTPVNQAAWAKLWQRVSTCVTRSLNVGTNLITVSLVNGDLERLQGAITCAPRRERVSWVCRVEVYGSILSPIYWAIRDGKFDIANFLITDALGIKADRDNYYYGREELHQSHKNMIGVMCRDCPELVETLCDGLLWHSQTVEDGRLRANYYIKDMYSDPNEVEDAWETPLAITCQEGQPDMFSHPVMEKLLQFKWHRFGRSMFIATQVWFLTLLSLYTAAFIEADPKSCTVDMVALKIITGLMAVSTFIFLTYISMSQYWEGSVLDVQVGRFTLSFPRIMHNPWQFCRFVSAALIIANIVTSGCFPFLSEDVISGLSGAGGERDILKSVTALFLFFQLFQAFTLAPALSALIYAITRLTVDIARNLFVIFIVLLAFTAGITALEMHDFHGMGMTSFVLLKATLYMEMPDLDGEQPFGIFLIISYMVIVCIGILSILVAQLSLAYNEISRYKKGFAMMNQAYVCVEVESVLSLKYRKKIFTELGFQDALEFDNGDEGPPGGIQIKEPASVRAHPKYCPDRIQRSTGSTNPADAWPSISAADLLADDQ